jgi:hypothetical protein
MKKYEATMRYYNYKPAELDKIKHKEPPLFPVSTFWTFILLTALLLFAIALLNRGF